MARFSQLILEVDRIVDGFFAELVSLLPYVKPGMSAAHPDTARPAVLNVDGIEATMPTTPVGAGAAMLSREIETDLVLSIRKEPVLLCRLTKGDRVRMEERGGEILEVTHIEPDATDRPKVHLIRLREP